MKPLLFLLTITLLTINASCRGDDDLPIRIKHETIRCKIDGVDWEAYNYHNEGSLFYDKPYRLLFYDDTGGFEIGAVRKLEAPPYHKSINFLARPIKIGGNPFIYWSKEFKDWHQPSGCKFYNLDTTQRHNLNVITIDTIDQYIIGEFEYSAINDCGDKVHITDGYFDLHYRF